MPQIDVPGEQDRWVIRYVLTSSHLAHKLEITSTVAAHVTILLPELGCERHGLEAGIDAA
jgi:hypothetical protein